VHHVGSFVWHGYSLCCGLSTDDRTIQITHYVEGSGFQGYEAMRPAKRHIPDDLNTQRN